MASTRKKPTAAPPAAAAPKPERGTAAATKPRLGGTTMSNRILLIDLAERELKERAKLRARWDQLSAIAKDGVLSSAQIAEKDGLEQMLQADAAVDKFYQVVASQVSRKTWLKLLSQKVLRGDETHRQSLVLEYGLFPSQQLLDDPADRLYEPEREVASICGLLELDNIVDPDGTGFIRAVAVAQGEYRENKALFDRAFDLFSHRARTTVDSQITKGTLSWTVLGSISPGGGIGERFKGPDEWASPQLPATARKTSESQGYIAGLGDALSALSARTVAAVVRRLVADHVTADDPWIVSRLESAFNVLTGGVETGAPSTLEIELPDLEESVAIDIVKENLHAVQAIYFAHQLEEMRLFQVVERIVELFRQGLLPLGRGRVGDYLFNYYKKAAERITESERRDLYFRAFGVPGGNPNSSEPNRDFNELWLRFLSAVSSFSRQLTVDRLLRSSVPMAVSQESVRKAGRDLGANLSRNGYGIAYFAATDLQRSILEFRDVLSDADLRNAFGARDMWQVIELVNANYLGGARNTHRFRTQSRAGAVVIRWIANHVQRLSNVAGPVLQIDEIVNPSLRDLNPNRNPTVDPSDWDLVNACEQWLAVGGVQEQSVEQYSQPIESPITSSRPIGMPQAARDALDAVGINLPA